MHQQKPRTSRKAAAKNLNEELDGVAAQTEEFLRSAEQPACQRNLLGVISKVSIFPGWCTLVARLDVCSSFWCLHELGLPYHVASWMSVEKTPTFSDPSGCGICDSAPLHLPPAAMPPLGHAA